MPFHKGHHAIFNEENVSTFVLKHYRLGHQEAKNENIVQQTSLAFEEWSFG
jgi:hypothetical protein